MTEERLVELPIGFAPEATISGGLLIQSEASVHLLFNAMSQQVRPSGFHEHMGVGVREFMGCPTTRFGYPNDEGRREHPLYDRGLSSLAYDVCEVLGSSWVAEWLAMAQASAVRIFGADTPAFHHYWERRSKSSRHFLVAFHDSMFECVAADLVASVDTRPWAEVIASIHQRVAEE